MNPSQPPPSQVHSASPAFSLCVYCGSKPGMNPRFVAAAREVGQWIGQHGGQLVYGGGNTGLMGEVAHATLAAGGRVVGIMPTALVAREFANRACTELHVVDNMHQRKALMAERADAFLALPGGIGTFEELFEVSSWRQLGYHTKSIGLLNVDGYYDGKWTCSVWARTAKICCPNWFRQRVLAKANTCRRNCNNPQWGLNAPW